MTNVLNVAIVLQLIEQRPLFSHIGRDVHETFQPETETKTFSPETETSLSRDETETRRWYVSRPSRDETSETETTSLSNNIKME